jgi:AraC-like DNA-binding protein
MDIDLGCLFVIPPCSTFHMYSPRNASVLACVVRKSHMDRALVSTPHVLEWLSSLEGDVGCLRAPSVARRLRQDAFNAIRVSGSLQNDGLDLSSIGTALTNSLISSLILDWHVQVQPVSSTPSRSFRRFNKIMSSLGDLNDDSASVAKIASQLDMSKRSIQYAFANEVSQGLSCYLRRQRLHDVRRSLLDPGARSLSIGDVAAQHGLWNWSHFSQQYRQLFGERPSETRSRLKGSLTS